MILVLRPEAEADLEKAFAWYEARRVGLGRELIEQVDAAFARVVAAPTSFPIVYRNLRRIVLKRFPYLVYFREVGETVEVLGVLHGRRDHRQLRRRPGAR